MILYPHVLSLVGILYLRQTRYAALTAYELGAVLQPQIHKYRNSSFCLPVPFFFPHSIRKLLMLGMHSLLLGLSYPIRLFFPIQLIIKRAINSQYDKREFQLYSYACVYWNILKKDWDTAGCQKSVNASGFLGCQCNHTTNFAVLMVSMRKTISFRRGFPLYTGPGYINQR